MAEGEEWSSFGSSIPSLPKKKNLEQDAEPWIVPHRTTKYCKALWVVIKTRKVLHKYNSTYHIPYSNLSKWVEFDSVDHWIWSVSVSRLRKDFTQVPAAFFGSRVAKLSLSTCHNQTFSCGLKGPYYVKYIFWVFTICNYLKVSREPQSMKTVIPLNFSLSPMCTRSKWKEDFNMF